MYLVLTNNSAHWAAGELAVADDNWAFTQLRLPYATQVRATGRAMAVQYENRKYITGQVSVPMLVDEYLRAFVLGIDPPHSAPTVAPAGAAAICYIRYVDELTGERSPLSAGTAVGAGPYTWTLPTQGYDVHPGTVTFAAGTVTGVGTSFGMMRPGDRIATSSAPTRYTMIKEISNDAYMTVDDAGIASAGDNLYVKPALRITHVELWRAVSGGLPRFVQRVPYGLVTVVENVATLALGEAETTSFTRMPYGTISAVYHDRLAIAGDPENPSLVYLSAQFYPERYEGLYYRTRSGRPIVALLAVRDHLLVMTDQDAEVLQGYTEDDITMEVKDPEIGALSQHLCDVVHGNAWIVSTKGWFMYNGEFHQMCSARLTEWKTLVAFMDVTQSHMYHNSFDQTVQLALRRKYKPSAYESGYTRDERIWVADISQVSALVGGGYTQPRWFEDEYDMPAKRWTTAQLFPDDRTYPMPRVFAFTQDGKVYREMQDWTEVWNTTAYSNYIDGYMVISSPMYMMGDIGGDIQEGKALTRFWLYCRAEYQEQVLNLYGGDDFAMWRNLVPHYGYTTASYGEEPIFAASGQEHYPIPSPAWTATLPASLIYPGAGNPRLITAAKVTHECVPEKVSGRGFGVELSIRYPQAVIFLGFGGQYKPGTAARGKDSYSYDAP
jgi:hypothetical protein